MNERIKQLVKQAEQYAIDNANEGTDEDFDYSFDDDFQEKFAELIIKECAGICEKDGKWWAEQGSLMEAGEAGSLAIQIRQHFGVEE